MKKVILSFDDGYQEDYTVVYPILKKKGLVATSYVITGDVGKNGNISWDEMKEMIKDGWDFQCHSHHHEMLTKLTDEEIIRDIMISKNEFFRRGLKIPEHFAYPFGLCDDRVKSIIASQFKTARGGYKLRGGDYEIKSYGLHGNHDINKLIKQNIIFLHTHDVCENNRGYGIDPKKFKKIINLLVDNGFEFITISQFFENKDRYKEETIDKKAVIMAAGSGTRWGWYLNKPKQLIEVDGEPIIKRTIRLLKENGINEIYVTVPEIGIFGNLDAEEILGSSEIEINKFTNAKEHSGAIFLWGDCYFSEDAIKKIVNNQEDLMFFGSAGGNKYTGKRWGEIFAVKTNNDFFEAVEYLEENKDKMKRCASWELYGYISTGILPTENFRPHKEIPDENGLFIPDQEKIEKYFTEINDFTDDFDYPQDYNNWIERYNRYFLKDVWDIEPRKKFTVSYNIMAHPSRKNLVEYLQGRLKNVNVIWDKNNNIWDTRKMCLEDHIKQGKDFGITIQDDSIICNDFQEKAERFINQIGEKEAIYNFFYTMYSSLLAIEEAIAKRENYIKNIKPGITSELCFAFPTHLMREMIDICNTSDKGSISVPDGAKEADWVMDERYVKDKGLYTYFTVPSLVDHRVELDSLYYPKGFIDPKVYVCRRAWWFYGELWNGQSKKDILMKDASYEPKETPMKKSKKDGFLCIKNTLPTGNIGYGTDLIFEPGETKCIKAEVAERIIKNSKGFICE